MQERTGIITFGGNPLTLLGPQIKKGDSAPDAVLLDNDMKDMHLSSYREKPASSLRSRVWTHPCVIWRRDGLIRKLPKLGPRP